MISSGNRSHSIARCRRAGRAGTSALVLVSAVLLAGATGCGSAHEQTSQLRQNVTAVAFAQTANAVPQSPTASVAVAFAAAQSAGNLNVVLVGWNDSTSSVASVSDSKGNPYQLAVGPTRVSGALSHSIYYAKNIVAAAAGANVVTVAFTAAAAYPDIRLLEYSGIDPLNPVDVTSAGSGSSSTSSTPAVTTTNANDLLVAGNVVTTGTTNAGSGFTSRVITSPDGDIAEDRTVSATGAYTSTAPLSPAGAWVMQMVAFRAASAPADTQPPTAPSNLTAAAASGTQINLGWTASTDNVGVTSYLIERCSGAGCASFSQIGTAAGTSFTDTGLVSGTSYTYRVRATDAAGNLSGYSNSATAATPVIPDTQPPTSPSNLSAVAASNSQINLSWTASTDNVGVTSYLIESCAGAGCTGFSQIGTASGTSFSHTGLTASTSYSYRVRASDAAGNLSGYSGTSTASTLAAPDTQPPSAPSGLSAVAASSSQINLSWTASTDNVAVTSYLIERCSGAGCASFAQIATAAGTTFTNTGLAAATSYSYRVRATDAAANLGAYSNTATAATPAAPQVPAYVQSAFATPQTPQTSVSVRFASAQSAGNLAVVIVGWSDSSAQVTSLTDTIGNTYQVAAPMQQTTGYSQAIYCARNIAAAAAGANTVTVTFSPAATYPDVRILEYKGVDTANPVDATASGTGTGGTSSTPALSTSTANDLIVAGNTVQTGTTAAGSGYTRRMVTSPDGNIAEDRIAASPGSYTATAALSGSGGWVMQAVAFHAAGTGGPDTSPPTAPGNLTATAASSSQINLAWTASSDNIGVTSYLIEGCSGAGCTLFSQIGTASGTSFNATGLSAGTSYSYRVRATDAAGNLSGYSATATAATPAPDTQPPTNPSNLTAAAGSSGQVNLTWTASTDDVGVSAYLIERCQGAGCTGFASLASTASTAYTDGSVSASTTYSYRVQATDAAGNRSGYSNSASATTPAAQVAPQYVQGNYAVPQTNQTTVTVPFLATQLQGDLNVVMVGWSDATAQVTGVSDTRGNSYSVAASPTVLTGTSPRSHVIWFASNIAGSAAGGNSVTVTFNTGAVYADVRIAEYSGIAASGAVDAAGGALGSGGSSTATVVTTNAFDLLVAANDVQTGTSGAGAGYTQRMLTDPDGDIVEDRVVNSTGTFSASAPFVSSGGWVMQMVAFKASGLPPPPDTNPPTASITSPAAGAALTGTVTVNVNASDLESGVAGVQLVVDGVAIGQPDTASPYTFSLDTTSFSNGAHVLGAYAWDVAGNIGNASGVPVTLSNGVSGKALQSGLWSGTLPFPMVAVHAHLLPDGKVLVSEGQDLGTDARVWNPQTNMFVNVPAPANIFCAGHEQMADGRIFIAGGHLADHMGITAANAFDPATRTWTALPEMANPRWYPTVTTLPDGRELVLAGESTCKDCDVSIPEIYSPATNSWTSLSTAPFTFPYYPHVFVLPDGRVLVPSTGEGIIVSQILDLRGPAWSPVGGQAVDGGSAAIFLPSRILKTGTAVDPDLASRPSVATAYVLDMTQASPAWRQVPSMSFRRTFHNMTLLPDGNVLVTGGGTTTAATDTANAVLAAEVWSPVTESWKTLASMHAPRLYHSNGLLLPDGRVLVVGGGRVQTADTPTDQLTAELFSPPYLFQGPRPVITSAPATLAYNQPFTIQTPDAARVARVSLIRFGSVTHAFNMGQRFLPLAFSAQSGSLTATAPVDVNLAPPGDYLLFLVDTSGVPSLAAVVRL